MIYRTAEKEVKPMSETASMSKKEVKAYVAELYSTISENKKKVSHELGLYKSAAKDVAGSAKYFAKAERAYEKKQSARREEKYEETKYDLMECAATYNSIGECINSLITDIRAAYAEIVELLPEKKAAKYAVECDKYLISINDDINKIQSIVEGVKLPAAPAAEPVVEEEPVVIEDAAIEEEPVVEEPAEETPCQCSAAPEAKILPVSVDVSSIVEKAIAATMQKFVLAFDKRIENFINEHPVNIPVGAQAPVAADPAAPVTPTLVSRTYGADEIMALESSILDDEQFLIDKLSSMMDSLKSFTAGMAELTAAYSELSDKQNEINEFQKQTNDIQRHTLREQQGIQVNQRVIAQDQISIAQEQTMLIEQQKSMAERQQNLTEAQQTMEETQRVLIDTQSTLEEAMKAVMQAQKDIIATQQSIIAGNNKNADLQAEIAERQAETLAAQKEALTSQKQVLREQRSTLEKQKDVEAGTPRRKTRARKAADSVEEAVEAPVAEEAIEALVVEEAVEAPVAEEAIEAPAEEVVEALAEEAAEAPVEEAVEAPVAEEAAEAPAEAVEE